jgi:hypothetical protein
MPRASLGPRLWFDPNRQNWVIRDGRKFIRTGAAGWKQAEDCLREYLRDDPLERRRRATAVAKPISGFVYFLTADFPDFPIKIGFTEKPGDMRSKSLQTGCPYRLIQLAMITGTYSDEKKLHRRFEAQRLEGEWFARSDDLMDLVEGMKDQRAELAALGVVLA